MINFTDLKKGIYDWVSTYSGIDAIWAFQNGAIPDKPFISMNLLNFNQVGDSSIIPSEVQTLANEHDIYTNVNFVLSLMGFGPGCIEAGLNMRFALNNDLVHQELFNRGVISWNNTNPLLNISGVDNDVNEERFSYDVDMRTCDIITDVPLGLIEQVNVEGTYKQPNKSDIINQINIDSTL